MMKDFKLGFGLMKYGLKVKLNVVMIIIIGLVGIAADAFNLYGFGLGSIFVQLAAIMPVSLLFTVGASELVQSSSFKKKLQVGIPTKVMVVTYSIAYVIILGVNIFKMNMFPEIKDELGFGMVFIGISGIVMGAYFALAYKKFVLSIILFLIFFLSGYSSGIVLAIVESVPNISFVVGAVVLFVGMVLGVVAYNLTARVVYRCEFSKYAFGDALKKA